MTPETQTQSVLDRALSLARQGFAVFPVNHQKKPIAGPGWPDYSTTDPETIATWWSLDYPDAMIAVHCGKSDLVVLDLDRHNEDADGFISMELAWLGIPPSFEYSTATNGGRHIWLRAPRGIDLPSAPKYRGMPGIDRKSGAGYVVVWASSLPDSIQLAEAPEWLLDTKERRTSGDTFEGGLDDYLESLTEGEPGEKVLAAIERIPEDFDHNELVARQMELVRLGAEGRIGVRVALDILREAWTRAPYDDESHRYEYDVALDGAIRKFGAQEARIAGLPKYYNCLQKLGAASTDMLVGAPKPKGHYFATVRHLVGQPDLTDHDIASLVWHAPATTATARDYGIDYLYAQIGSARMKANAPIENPSLGAGFGEDKQFDLTLLSEEERAQVACVSTWIDGYMDWAKTKVNVINEPYHRQNALSVLACSFGSRVFAPLKSRAMGVNLFQLGLGESSTGKSESISLRDQIVRAVFTLDPTYDVGSNPSPEALHEVLLKRDHQTSFFNTDEAAAPLDEFLNKSYQSGAVDRLTSYYEGYVAPMLRRGQGGQATNQSAVVSFNIAMFGTPDRVLSLLTREQFESGFLARFLWTISADVVPDDSQYEESEATERVVATADPAVDAFADALGRRGEAGRLGSPVLANPDSLRRLSANRKKMAEALKDHEQWSILQPSVRRLGDNIRKIGTLLTAASGSERMEEHHVLAALELGEHFLENLESVARRVSASAYARACDEVEAFVISQGGSTPISRVFHRLRAWELKDVATAIEGLVQQGRVKRFEANAQRGERLEINLAREE